MGGIGKIDLRGGRSDLRYNALQGMTTALVRSPAIDPHYACFKLAIRESKIHRRGVYAMERIPARRKVIEYTGERIGRRETKRRGQGPLTYLFTLDDYWTIDGAVGGSGAEIINHSCDPNLVTTIRKGHILYMSKRAIQAGEELTVDYRFSEKIDRVRCRCGAATCRGVINLK
jgi:SET domain-containing protein